MQRYFSPEEYAAMGYQLKQDVRFKSGSYQTKTFKPDFFDVAYRADTREQYAIDLGVGLVKLAWAYGTGGIGPAAKTAIVYTYSLAN
jgi:hypothetical protein|tara:strand:- start:737 stop:997 length:261 start_codon:yes stop_codon:yes gene_type:complete